MLGIFATLILLAYGCQTDRTYRDEYIQLLEERINSISPALEEAPSDLLSQQEIMEQVEEVIDFACGSENLVKDIRVRQNALNEWSILVELQTDSIDPYGFLVSTRVLLEGEVNRGILEITNVSNLINACK
jgi:citrate lyase beta subunit